MEWRPYDAEVEYIESNNSGSFMVNTGHTADTGYFEAEIYATAHANTDSSAPTWQYGFFKAGAASNDSSRLILYSDKTKTGTARYWRMGTGTDSVATVLSSWPGWVVISKRAYDTSGRETPAALSLFGTGTSTNSALPMRLYSFKVYSSDGTTVVRDYIPVRVGSVGCLYDQANPSGGPNGNGIYANVGTGTFTLGRDKIVLNHSGLPTDLFPMGSRAVIPASTPYVTNGLVAWWDGLWNAGVGVHSSSATTWKDLVGSRNLTLASSGVSWYPNALNSAISSGCAAKYTSGFSISSMYTVEIVKSTTIGRSVLIVNPSSASSSVNGCFLLGTGDSSFRVAFGQSASTRREIAAGNIANYRSISIRYSTPGAVASSCMADGSSLALSHNSSWGNSNNYAGIRVFGRQDGDGYGSNGYPVRGYCHCIRIYNRQLTDDEVAANYAVDKQRFGLP